MLILAALVVALVVYWLIPSYPETAAELFGTYVADHKLVHDEFTLRPDGSFVQTVTVRATSQVVSSQGTWTYDPGNHYVTFRNGFLVSLRPPSYGVDLDYAHQWPVVVYPVRYWFGRLVFPEINGRQEWKKVCVSAQAMSSQVRKLRGTEGSEGVSILIPAPTATAHPCRAFPQTFSGNPQLTSDDGRT